MRNKKKNEELEFLRAQVRNYESLLNYNDGRVGAAFKLTPTTANVLGLLLSVNTVTANMIRDLKIGTDAKVAVCRLRHALKPWGLTVNSRRGIGYWIDAPTKDFIRKQLSLPA